MKETLLTILRDKKSKLSAFREASRKLSSIMAAEIASKIKQNSIPIETTLTKTHGFTIAQEVVLVPILRSGMALLPAFLYFFDTARVGFLGMKRDEKTAKPHLYYEKLPTIAKNTWTLILDPMIATGGSSIKAIKKLLQHGAEENNIMVVSIVAAPEGVQAIQREHPNAQTYIVAIDEKLNPENFIMPGLGDFGDRYFYNL